jgi:5-oxoprolinase (ATP-hydrolysing) subunit A
MHIDLNCDMGESFGRYALGNDAAMLDVITSANIACGFHAGDPSVMRRTVALAATRRVTIGAHPGYPDLQGFGRRAMAMSPDELEASIIYQLGALAAFAGVSGVPIVHIKPHGALYNTAAAADVTAMAVVRAVAAYDPTLIIVTLPGSVLAAAAASLGLQVANEGFADRAYQDNGALVPRARPGALIEDPDVAAARAVRMVTDGVVTTITGNAIPLRVDTLCIHGDTPGAPEIAGNLRQALEQAGIEVRGLGQGASGSGPQPL